jgi:hypothetical protein
MRFAELTDLDPAAATRVSNSRNPFVSIGVHRLAGGEAYLYLFSEGKPVRMLSRTEISKLLTDTDDDWRVSNQ